MSLKSLFKSSPKKSTSTGAPGPSTQGGSPSNAAVQDTLKSSVTGGGSSLPVLGAVQAQQPAKGKGGGLGALFHKAFKTETWKQQQAAEEQAKAAFEGRVDDTILKLSLDVLLGDLREVTFACLKQEAMPEVIAFIETHDGEHDGRALWETFFLPGAPQELNTGKKEREELQALADAGLYDAMDFTGIRERVLTEPMQQVKTRMLGIAEVRTYVAERLGPVPTPEPTGGQAEAGQQEGSVAGGTSAPPGGGGETGKPKAKLGGLSLAFHRTFQTGTYKRQQAEEAQEREALERRIDAAFDGLQRRDFLAGGLRAFTFEVLRSRSDDDVVDFLEDYDGGNRGRHMWETYVAIKAPKLVNVKGSVRNDMMGLVSEGRYDELDFTAIYKDILESAVDGAKHEVKSMPGARAVMKASLGAG